MKARIGIHKRDLKCDRTIKFDKYLRENNLTFDNLELEEVETGITDKIELKMLERKCQDLYEPLGKMKKAYLSEEELKEYKKEYYENNKDEIKEYKKEYYEQNKDEINRKNKEYQKNYKSKEYRKNYYERNKDDVLKNQKEYQKANRDRINEYQRQYRAAKNAEQQVAKEI